MADARREVTICNQRGLHARASAKFVKAASAYDADITVVRGADRAPGDSIMELLMLAAGPGSTIAIEAVGEDADAAAKALADLVECRFGEDC